MRNFCTWCSVFDSGISGEYAETALGHVIDLPKGETNTTITAVASLAMSKAIVPSLQAMTTVTVLVGSTAVQAIAPQATMVAVLAIINARTTACANNPSIEIKASAIIKILHIDASTNALPPKIGNQVHVFLRAIAFVIERQTKCEVIY